MSKYLVIAVAAAAAVVGAVQPALATPTVENPEPHITVFRDGDHIVTLVGRPDGSARNPILKVLNEDEFGQASTRGRSPIPMREAQGYYVRVRVVDGRLICEKFAVLPRKQPPAERAAELFRESCS